MVIDSTIVLPESLSFIHKWIESILLFESIDIPLGMNLYNLFQTADYFMIDNQFTKYLLKQCKEQLKNDNFEKVIELIANFKPV